MADEGTKLRIDKWLWFSRAVKTRSLAAKLVEDGHVRVNSERVTAPSKSVRTGDVLTIALERQVLVWKILALGTRRGPAPEAQALYENLTPAPEKKETVAVRAERDDGAGRPTKKERRDMEKWRGGE
ncbi:MAG: RNA-binding S4 domain-containing protein [Beijerinckiaceae bacterium]